MDRYKIIKTLGEGTFAIVYKASNIKTGEIVAIKKMKRKYTSWDDCIQLREIKSLRKLNHTGIIKLKEVIKVKDELYLVFEYLEQDLYHLYTKFKERNQAMTEQQIKNIMWQCCNGLQYMHKNGFFHRDLKPENLLVHGNIIKICDFGLAREIRSRPPFTDYVSTRWYRAPEILLRSTNYNSPVDIFALGCIFAELYLLAPLFPGSSEVDQIYKICQILGTPSQNNWNEGYKLAAQTGFKFPQFPAQNLADLVPMASSSAIKLLQEMLQYDPQKRLTAQQIMNHEYFEGFNQQQIPIMPRQPTPTKKQIATKKENEDSQSISRLTDKRFKKTNQKIQDLIESAQKLDKTQERLQNRKNSKMYNADFNQSKRNLPQLNQQTSNVANLVDQKLRNSTEDFIDNMLKDDTANNFQRQVQKKNTQKQNIEDFINQISEENTNAYTRNAQKKATQKLQNVDDVINQVSKDRLFERLAQKKKDLGQGGGISIVKLNKNQQGNAGTQQDYTIESDNESPTYGSDRKNIQMPMISNKSVMKNQSQLNKDFQRRPSEADRSNKEFQLPQISNANKNDKNSDLPISRQYNQSNLMQKPPSQLMNKYMSNQTNKQQPMNLPNTINQKYDFQNQQKMQQQQTDILDILNKNPLGSKPMFQKPQQQPLLPQLSQKKIGGGGGGYNDNPLLQPNLLNGITNKKANFMSQQNEYDQMQYGGGNKNQIGTKFMLGGGAGIGNIYNKDLSNHHSHENKFNI